MIDSDEKNESLKTLYKEKMQQYMDRAEYIKKQVLSTTKHQIAPEDPPPTSGGGDGATASAGAKPKTKYVIQF